MAILSRTFYTSSDTVQLAQDLLGKTLVSTIDGVRTAGIIVETEAYRGPEDKAAHTYKGRNTERTKVFFELGGMTYVYRCYGMHHLFNVVTGQEKEPHAILIRAIEPTEGIDKMLERRKMSKLKAALTAGPARVTKAMGILTELHYALPVYEADSLLTIETGIEISPEQIIASPRVGVAYAQEDALLPWRFRVKDNIYTSPAK